MKEIYSRIIIIIIIIIMQPLYLTVFSLVFNPQAVGMQKK